MEVDTLRHHEHHQHLGINNNINSTHILGNITGRINYQDRVYWPQVMRKSPPQDNHPTFCTNISSSTSSSLRVTETTPSSEAPATQLGSSEAELPSTTMYQYEHIMTFDTQGQGGVYGANAGTGSSNTNSQQQQVVTTVKRKKSIKSDSSIELRGPMEVDGSVKSGGGVAFSGNFAIRDRIEAYGDIDIIGDLRCNNKLKAYGNVKVNGSALCVDRVKIFGKLKITGTFEVQGDLEVWGAITINGYLKCKTLTAYASITTVGDQSWYQTEQGETVHGAKLIQRTNYEG